MVVRGKLYKVYKTGYSYYGNPHHDIAVLLEDGNLLFGRTATNGAIGYEIRNGGEGENARTREWTFHETRKGSIIFDYVNETGK